MVNYADLKGYSINELLSLSDNDLKNFLDKIKSDKQQVPTEESATCKNKDNIFKEREDEQCIA